MLTLIEFLAAEHLAEMTPAALAIALGERVTPVKDSTGGMHMVTHSWEVLQRCAELRDANKPENAGFEVMTFGVSPIEFQR